MPYRTTAELPKAVKDNLKSPKDRRMWLAIFNSAHERCMGNGGSTKDCEASAFAQANGMTKAGSR